MNEEEWPKFLTVQEAAAIMRVSKMTVYRLIRSRQIESKRVGRSFRVKEASLHAYLASDDALAETPGG